MKLKQALLITLSIVIFSVLSGCATVENNYDPIEPVNRGIYKFNDVFDKYLLRPVTKGYDKITPDPMKRGITNFFFNLGGVRTIVNDVLQGKLQQAANDTGRFVVNSTIGVLGFFDVATHFGLDKNDEDLGQTFGAWGLEESSYFVIPFLGPSTFRDGIGKVGDYFLGPYPYIEDDLAKYSLLALDAIETRQRFLGLDETIEEQLDPYTYVRDIYLEKRRMEIADKEEETSAE